MNFFSWNKNATRLLTGLILGTIVLYSLIQGGIALLVLVSIVVALGAIEYVKILQHKGFYPSLRVILFADALFALIAYFNRFDLVAVTFTICSIAAFLSVLFRGRQPYIANVSTTVLGFLYSGWFPLHLIFLRDLPLDTTFNNIWHLGVQTEGLKYVLIMFMTVLATDTGCYYFGRNFGKHKLAPVISPNKTIEGSIGGLICAILCSMLFGYVCDVPWYHSLIFGILTTIFAQLGDLCESLIKRDAGVKDSGNTLPGHGGFLDRTDSFIFTIPIAYYYFNYFVVSNDLWLDIVSFFKGIF